MGPEHKIGDKTLPPQVRYKIISRQPYKMSVTPKARTSQKREDRQMLSGGRGINSPHKNWFYLKLSLSGKVKKKKKPPPPPKKPKTQVYLDTTLHIVYLKKIHTIGKQRKKRKFQNT